MMRRGFLLLAFIIIEAEAGSLPAQPVETVQTAASYADAMQYLGAGARPQALGSAFTAVGGDLGSLYFNPAGLGSLRMPMIGLDHHNWLAGIRQESLGAAMPGDWVNGGVSVDWIDYGSIDGADASGQPTGNGFVPISLGAAGDLAKRFDNGLSLGLRLKVSHSVIQGAEFDTTNLDLGSIWSADSEPFSLGISYSGIGVQKVQGFAAAPALHFGLAYDSALSDQVSLLILGGFSGMSSGGQQLQLGVEGNWKSMLALRLGYQLELLDNLYNGFSGLSSGLGVSFGNFALDYAFVPYGQLGASQRLSLSYRFGKSS